ncbi:exodeoxyribonuclease V subunit beta [Motiliproteus sp. MSK22-1]|uniref:UvrD-helicase domain-containing protein n=1 Tax=Motiliproteus sp. MSK22-1 TaxID=1897630 RepID=UPI0009789730|nr:UvrD-helicase domain-containing protein [Motiliproteus sp. MSK22-1]OMH32641.1 hypothetical protein BGP75_13920 [Motiliproteus sp. MSK22-1]
MSDLPADHRQRLRCLQPDQSFCVRAPAGSGKTELLTQRVLVLLASVQKPEEILCITFTRKAAAEMQDRILQALRWAATTDEPESGYRQQSWRLAQAALAQDRQLNWQLLNNPSRLRIQTIDGLCARFTKSLPALSNFGAQPDILQDPFPIYQLAVQRLLEQLESDEAIATALEKLLLHLDNQIEVVERLLISMLAKRDQWLGLVGAGNSIRDARSLLEQALQRLLQEELDELSHQLNPFESDLVMLLDYGAGHLQQEESTSSIPCCIGIRQLPACHASELPLWRGIAELLLTDKGEWRKTVNKRQGFPPGSNKLEKEQAKARKSELMELLGQLQEQSGLLGRLARIRILPTDQYDEKQWALLEALTVLLPHLAAHLLISFSERGAVDYPQITSAALVALGDDDNATDLSLILDYQIHHILVDEFQDTSSPQIELLQKLTRGWEPGDGRTLFIVGDGMQSCYGFRDANVGLFLDARKHGLGDVQLEASDLCVNFRSQRAVVEWVNHTFREAFPEQDDISRGAVSYEDSVAFNAALDGKAVITRIFVGYEDRRAEGEEAAMLVRKALDENPDGSVAILVRNRSHLRQILPALRDEGLRWQATDLDSLASRMWVVDLISLLRALLNPADRIAWLSVLRAPWCGLSNEDLLSVAGGDGKSQSIWGRLRHWQSLKLSEDGRERIISMAAILESSWENKQRKTLRNWIEGTWLALGGAAALRTPAQLGDVQRVFDLLDQHDHGALLLNDDLFLRDLERLYAAPDSDADPRIQVMTIHKSKGLEFDTVILAGLDRSPRAEDKQLLLWQQRLNQDGGQDLLLGPLAATGEEEDPLYHYLSKELALKNQMEGTRLLYVGATRAIKRLYLLGHLNLDPKTERPKPPSSRSLLASIWPSVKEEAEIILPQEQRPTAANNLLKRIQRIPVDFKPVSIVTENLLLTEQSAPAYLESEDNLPTQSWQQNLRHIGTLTHRILQQLVIHNELYGDLLCGEPQHLEDFHPAWSRQLRQLGVPGHQCAEAVIQVHQLISNTLADEKGRWILDPNHRQSACELPISYDNGFQIQHLIIDRTFIDSQGTRWIIDYKTAEAANESDFSLFIEQEEQRYKKQLSSYCRALTAMESNTVKAALYFPESGYFHELSL